MIMYASRFIGDDMTTRPLSSALRLLLVMMISVLGFAVLPASTASAASSCYGSSCEGLDPATTNCADDAYTLLIREAVTPAGNWGNLELRYSSSCYSNWVRFTPWYGIQGWINGYTRLRLHKLDLDGHGSWHDVHVC